MNEKDLMAGFAKGLRILGAFGPARQRLSIAEAATATGLDRAVARRCLLTLVDTGYADCDGKYFTLTPKVLRLGHAWLTAAPLPALLQPHLDALSGEVEQSASASILDDTEIVYIARAAQRRVMSINLMPGSRLPAFSASMGRVLLAALPPAAARAVIARSRREPRTPFTRTDPNALWAEIERVRDQGYAVIDQELEIGLCSIAVPVLDGRGRTVAAINIGVSAAVCPASELPARFLQPLQQRQAALRETL